MKISIIQLNITLNVEKNFEDAINFINISKSDIVCLPELFLTGFRDDTLNFAQDMNGKVFKKLKEISKENKILLIAGMCEKQKNKQKEIFYNSAYIFDNGDFKGTYRKIHLFKYWNEHLIFSEGNKIFTYDYKGTKIGIIICYDIRFPELARKLMKEGVEILIVLANFPEERIKHWEILNRARAIENLFYVIGNNANIIEFGKESKKFGNSVIVSPDGKILKEAKNFDEGEILEENLDMEYLRELRKRYGFLNDVKLI